MLPVFPKFKKLELGDRIDIDQITSQYAPYSDFNFVSMWSWDIKGEMRISVLNHNLVVRFTDYVTKESFYSFLGNNKVQETLEALFEFFKTENLKLILKLVPEKLVNNLVKPNFNLILDQDSYDYIYSVSHLSSMNDWAKNSSGKNIRNFIKKGPNYVVKHSAMTGARKDEYVEMFEKWAKDKAIENYLKLQEFEAFERIFETKHNKVSLVSIYIKNLLVGFTVYEILSSDYAISHFAKSDTTYHRAINDILNWEEAKILDKRGIKYFNWEQDLGILGLRKSKEKYKPSFLLKKLTIGYKD